MTAPDLLAEADRLGIRLYVADTGLGYDAPAGALTPELRAELVEHKAELLVALVPPLTGPTLVNPDSYADDGATLWAAWLGDLLRQGHVGRLLGPRAAARASDLLGQPMPDDEAARPMVLDVMARLWPERYRAAGIHHDVLNP